MHNDAHPSMDCAYNFPGALSESLTPESVDPRGHDPGFIWSLYDVMGWLYMTSSVYIYMTCISYGMALYGVYVYMIWLYINDVMYVIGYCDDPIGIQTTRNTYSLVHD